MDVSRPCQCTPIHQSPDPGPPCTLFPIRSLSLKPVKPLYSIIYILGTIPICQVVNVTRPLLCPENPASLCTLFPPLPFSYIFLYPVPCSHLYHVPCSLSLQVYVPCLCLYPVPYLHLPVPYPCTFLYCTLFPPVPGAVGMLYSIPACTLYYCFLVVDGWFQVTGKPLCFLCLDLLPVCDLLSCFFSLRLVLTVVVMLKLN